VELYLHYTIRGLTIKFANSPLCAWSGSSGQKPQYGLMTVADQSFTAVMLLLIYGSLFLSGIYYCLECVFGVLHHDNAPAHTALSVREFLASKQLCWNTLHIHRI
jgi:hypothetical protein